MSQENTNQPQTAENKVEAVIEKPHEIKMAESYLDEKLKEFFQGKDEVDVKPVPGSMVLNFVSEDSTPSSILDVKTMKDASNPQNAAANATDVNGAEPKTSIRTKEHQGGHPVNINTICLFACKTVEEFNKASNLMMTGVEKLNAAKDVVDKVIDKVAIFVPESQRRDFSKNIHHGMNRVEEIIEFIVEISKFPNWVNAEKWIMNTLEDLKPRCRFIPCVDRDLKKKIAKRQKESQDLLEAEKKAAKEEKARVDKLVAAEKAEADKKAKEEMKAKKEADEAEAKAKKEADEAEKRQQKEAEKSEKERAKKEKADAERKRKEEELQAKLEELKMTPEEREAKKKAQEDAERKRKEEEIAAKKLAEEEAKKKKEEEIAAKKAAEEKSKADKIEAERKRKEEELQAKLEELKMTPEEREAKKKAAEEAEKKRKEQEKLDKKAAKLQAELDKLKPKPVEEVKAEEVKVEEVEENKTE